MRLPFPILFLEVPRVMIHFPVLWFFLVAHVLFPEQVVAIVKIIGDGHVEGTTRVFVMVRRHLYVDRAEFRVGDGGRGVFGSFAHPLALILLRLAPLHTGHVGRRVGRYFPVVGAAKDQPADPACEPFDDGVKTNFCHSTFSLS
jgi:hypothetical protein